jgi:hypothetical protein
LTVIKRVTGLLTSVCVFNKPRADITGPRHRSIGAALGPNSRVFTVAAIPIEFLPEVVF